MILVVFHGRLDSRDDVYSASKGIQASVKSTISRIVLGSTSDFENTDISGNYYVTLKNTKFVSAIRLALAMATGDVPFQSLNIVGGKDIRGYTKGTYRGMQRYALKSELRYTFLPRMGVVGFAGVAYTTNSGTGSSPLLPGVGTGFRYLMLPVQKIKVGMDMAIGKDDWGIYFRIGEAF